MNLPLGDLTSVFVGGTVVGGSVVSLWVLSRLECLVVVVLLDGLLGRLSEMAGGVRVFGRAEACILGILFEGLVISSVDWKEAGG